MGGYAAFLTKANRASRTSHHGWVASISGRLQKDTPDLAWQNDESLVKSEIFGMERLEAHARSLAAAQTLAVPTGRHNRPLSKRLSNNRAFLRNADARISEAIALGSTLTPAAQWLADNYTLIDMQIRETDLDLPPRFYARLPKLADGPFSGLPRVFGVAWAYIAHTDSHVLPETLYNYLLAYQSVVPLGVGELWAVSITLRIVLIENLRRVVGGIMRHNASKDNADRLADELGLHRKDTPGAISGLLETIDPDIFDHAFAAQLSHRLRGLDPEKDPALVWLEQRLVDHGATIESAVRADLQEQGAFNATIRNIITSLRLIGSLDWTEAFDRVCPINLVLAEFESFTQATFASRDLYYKAVEELAYGSTFSEMTVAELAVTMAHTAKADASSDARRTDPGYYLLMAGRAELEMVIGYRLPWRHMAGRHLRAAGIAGYCAAVIVLTMLFLGITTAMSWQHPSAGLLILVIVLASIPLSDAAVALVNRMALKTFHATMLPGFAFRDGIPDHLRTMVVIPALLTTRDTIDDLVARLELHHLSTREDAVHFALLTDWTDHNGPNAPADDTLLDLAKQGVARLNSKYGPAPGGVRFHLLHRSRVWSESERVWMGWERKRGKLHEFNRLLRGASDTTFLTPDHPLPASVQYVVTLDADTRLPLETIHRLIGKMSHPLNAPVFDQASSRVCEGYAILQPRVTPSLPIGHESTLFQRVFASIRGIDGYSAAVSDLYQDMFGEGSYAGKGIYHVDAFEAALSGRVPDSTLLSHDLFEGIFARAGLVTDIEVVEEFPGDYLVAAQRGHRWTRGDWQLLPWLVGGLFRRDPTPRERFSGIAQWKMLDNLRRTLCPPLRLLALLATWLLPFHAAVVWTIAVLLAMSVPTFLPVLPELLPRRDWITWNSYLRGLSAVAREAAIMTSLNIVFMVHQAHLMADAIWRTLVRVFLTRQHMLQWVPAAQIQGPRRSTLAGYYFRMAAVPVLVVAIIVIVAINAPENLLPCGMLSLPWLLSPALAMWASRTPVIAARTRPSRTDIRTLRMTARRTWRFFETFVTPEDHMLPPDNFQEEPAPVLAHRTSPTNIGLYLLCAASAHDFGWAGLVDTVQRLEETFATLERMPRYRGHFYNWYATDDLKPLDPVYISSVDSGNLAGHLIALSRACQDWSAEPQQTGEWREGAVDALNIAMTNLTFQNGVRLPNDGSGRRLLRLLAALKGAIMSTPDDALPPALEDLCRKARTVEDFVTVSDAAHHSDSAKARASDRLFWILAPRRTIESRIRDLDPQLHSTLAERFAVLARKAAAMAHEMDFRFLCNQSRHLLSIGYVVSEDACDVSCYDLLASEARLAVFFAIAKGDMTARDWFKLGRTMTPAGNGAALISWSGSMFEYLMPSLVMRAPIGSLLEQTNALIVERQIAYGQAHHRPWGVSESAYNLRDLDYTYQYSNFGVPGLGLKRGLGLNLVIAPYATLLAAMVDPQQAVANLTRLERTGALGHFGFYEALDFTRERIPDGSDVAIVRAYMAHHQGMSILAAADAVMNGIMRARFHDDPVIASAELLLQERAPRAGAVARPLPSESESRPQAVYPTTAPAGRFLNSADTPEPVTHLLSNGRYSVMLTAAGSGYSRWNGQAVTRWREDLTRDDHGSYLFMKNRRTGSIWSAGLQPCDKRPDTYGVAFHEDRADFVRQDDAIITTLEIRVSAEDDAEVRVVSLLNTGSEAAELDVTSYIELALLAQNADLAHPAFTKLFVQTEYMPQARALIATRRKRMSDEPEIWAAHLIVTPGPIEIETDRARFIGRGRDLSRALTITDDTALSGSTGTVLDPIFSIRTRISVRAGSTVHVAFWTMTASSRAALLDMIDTHADQAALERVRTLSWTQAQVQLRHLDIMPPTAELFQRLASHILYAGPSLRRESGAMSRGAGAQSLLWEQGISGDLPILVLRVGKNSNMDTVRTLLLAHEYFRLKLLAADFVILNEQPTSYLQELQTSLEQMIHAVPRAGEAAGAVRVLRTDLVSSAARSMILSTARVVLTADQSLLQQLDQAERSDMHPPVSPAPRVDHPASAFALPAMQDLEFFNGHGGFADDGAEYVVVLRPGQTTPAPWVNVIANDTFGFQVSADGSGYTWSGNSRDHQITPWSNDPVCDRAGEVFYLRDENTGTLWCPAAAVRRDRNATYVTHHGRGYSRQERVAHGIASTLLQYVPPADPIKITRLALHNHSSQPRTLSVTAYVEWVLGAARGSTAPFTVTELDEETGTLFARNSWDATYGGCVAFADIGGYLTAVSGDRTHFLGRNGTTENPAAFSRPDGVKGQTGAGLDPCGVLQTIVTLPPGGKVEVLFLLGEGASADAARALVARYRTIDLDAVLNTVQEHWRHVTDMIQVRTPDRSMDLMLNGWLLYQTLSSRVQARAGFYQASGAYGFRDQLQDGMALALSCPERVRGHLLRAAGQQFIEGDVQHWWLPQTGAGVRTHISDDRAWLAYAVAHYITTTGDAGILDEVVNFLEAPALPISEHDRFAIPATSVETGSLFEHCARALDHSMAVGAHGLPLMGTGDWNDGMNRVGEQGRGESIWLGWFLHAALHAFIPLAQARRESARARAWQDHASALVTALETTWDGDWYLRAYFDGGTPLGSRLDTECQIDAIAQSWAVLSKAASPERAEHAMRSVLARLSRPKDKLVLVLSPPFDTASPDPGYIRGYPPGIRENGGQYTHAALWTVMAVASLGDGDRAQALFHTLNPVNHARTPEEVARYHLEPYVVAADIYSTEPHVGRGGWSWYTGSAGWMQRVGTEFILGIQIRGDSLLIDPCIPRGWPDFEATIRWRRTSYHVSVFNPMHVCRGVSQIKLDGNALSVTNIVNLVDDGGRHEVDVQLGGRLQAAAAL
ncbi:GH36-type glycosyl hydrolase domain-containing protein [Tanticharoenia sakaeratensis]|uniref:Protein ndvB n=1 Tax=Tanticharoenia sakaeratensis NBRC 103193 TaxID=1231623 RepID=A0A0D6MK39_9PROT|nr:glucoamylase family protein [Tanticharoenia sakaeratensis]GAN54039.1 protein ndvB [Tanticharoenia sakaeratensis NBRC 103193]GBQ23663.1 cyclic beta 1-2 glucan synthetase [Tanticharoenia sakaeratensis NBRC 103193]